MKGEGIKWYELISSVFSLWIAKIGIEKAIIEMFKVYRVPKQRIVCSCINIIFTIVGTLITLKIIL